MKGRTIRGCMSGEFRHIPNKPKTFGWLNDFILTHSSMKLFMSFVECISECVGWEEGNSTMYVIEVDMERELHTVFKIL